MGLTYINPYFPMLVAFVVAFVFAGGLNAVSLLLGPTKKNDVKYSIYECGIPPISNARQKITVKFYLTALLFIIFDIEAVFMFLWSTMFEELGWFGIIEISVFVFTLLIGYVYVIKRGALDWD